MTEQEKKKIMDEAVESSAFVMSFHGALEELEHARWLGLNVYIKAGNGAKLYALLDDEDSCYKKVYRMSKKEREEYLAKEEEKEIQQKLKAIEKIPARVERGHKIIDKNKKMWEDCVKKRTDDLFDGAEIDHSLDLMEEIKKGNYDKAYQKLLDSGHSVASLGIVQYIITTFLKDGSKFWDYVDEIEGADEND